MQLAAHAVVFLFRPDGLRTHAREGFIRRFDWAREHETDRLKERDCARLELSPFATNGRLADVTGDEVHALDLGDRDAESFSNRGLDEALAETDAELPGDDLDEEPRGLGVQAHEQRLQRFGFGCASRGADGLQRRLDLLEGYRL